MKECRYTVCRPVQTTTMKTVCRDRATRPSPRPPAATSARRSACRGPSPSRSRRECGEWVDAAVLRARQDGLRQRLLVQCPPTYLRARRSGARAPVVENVSCTVYERQIDPQAGARHGLQAGAVLRDRAGPGHHLHDGRPRSASSRSRSPPAGWSRRPDQAGARDRLRDVPQECVKQVPVTVCRMVQETCTKTVPYTVCTTEARTVHAVRAGQRDQDVPQDRCAARRPYTVTEIVPETLRQAGARTPSPGWSRRRRASRSPARSPGWSARPASSASRSPPAGW